MCVTSCHQFAENMVTAQKRDAARQGQFYFRKNVTAPESDTEEEDGEKECAQCCPDEYTLMSADTIINGKVPANLCVYLYTHLHYVHTLQRNRHSHSVYTLHHVLSLSPRTDSLVSSPSSACTSTVSTLTWTPATLSSSTSPSSHSGHQVP